MPLRVPPLVRRILSRLIDAETQETDPWLRDDLQIARLTVAYAARGEAVLCSPDVLASYAVRPSSGKSLARDSARRKALLGPFCEVVGTPQLRGEMHPKKPGAIRQALV